MKQITGLRTAIATMAVIGSFCATEAMAQQIPARFYLKNLDGGNGIPIMVNSMSGNTNPFDLSHSIIPSATPSASASFDATLAMAGYAHTFALFDRAATAAVLLPMGRMSGDVLVAGKTVNQQASGFGDPMLEFDINLIGPRSQKNIPDAIRYEPGFSLDVLVDLAVPIGEYDNTKQLNIGQNRWYGRVGAPTIIQLGPWIPGQRTTLEFLPAVWFFGDNSDFYGTKGGQTKSTEAMFQLDAHLTRDFTANAWGALDATWFTGGQNTIDGQKVGGKLNNLAVGLTLGYNVNDNMAVTFSYKSTVNDTAPGDLSMNSFFFTLIYGWHPMIEGMKRLKEN